MPATTIQVFRRRNGEVPLIKWLDELEENEPRAHRKCLERILSLSSLGNQIRRPLADNLGDGIFELRTQIGRVHYRILYFFYGTNNAVLSHGLTKEGAVPAAAIQLAKDRRAMLLKNSLNLLAEWEL